MKLKIVLLVSLLSIIMVGCSSLKENTTVHDGKEALEAHDYEKARDFLSDALEMDSSDEHARAMYMQATKMENALEYEKEGNYNKAIKELEAIEEIKNGSAIIKTEADAKKKDLIKANEEYLKAREERKQNAKEVSHKDQDRIEEQASIEKEKHLAYLAQKKKQEDEEAKKKVEEEANKPQEPNQGTNELENPGVVVSPPVEQTVAQ
ncbi:tetratricopeptide repeat protein [Romboutsia lituseburensis]|uniref:tetratricopeptide repeat protein n=1 Tax=Romboutsia lituseburensis TaxID=1537 RepID=UPI0022EAB4DD|nr:hypothetical protein [Romboutsia lituseburensis]